MLNLQKGFAQLSVLLLLIAAVGVGVFLVTDKTSKSTKSSASESPSYLNEKYLSEDSTTIGQKAVSADGTGIAAQTQIQQQRLLSTLAAGQKPNIVIIISDDQTYNQLSLAGNPVLKTPNIDSLANPGAYFKNAYVPEGICSPSRASIWTSKLPHIHGVYAVGMILPTDQITLPEILQANGYNTGFVGKCHLGDENAPEEYTRGFDFRLINKLSAGRVPDWYNYQVTRNGALETHTQYVTDFLTDEAVKYIGKEAADYKQNQKPFFLWLAQPAPHYPTIPPNGSNRYTQDQMPLPVSISDDLTTKPPLESAALMHKNYQDLGPTGIKAKLKDSYEVIANLDDNVGRVNQTLKDLGIKDDTVVIYLSDNGIMFGEHQLYQKGPYFYEEQVKSPLIFSYPKIVSQYKTIGALTSTMDIMPTLLDILKIPNPANIQGKSFLNVLTGGQVSHRNSIYLEYPTQAGCMTYPMKGVVMGGFKWVQYEAGKYDAVGCATGSLANGTSYDGYDQELFDLSKDPYEMNNLMKRQGLSDNPLERMLLDPTYGKTVQKLRKERAVLATDSNDPDRFILTDGAVTSTSPTQLTVTWKNAQGMPTTEVEYNEKNCGSCPVLEYNDLSHTTASHQAVLNNLKPNTTYTIRAFSISRTGTGGYLNLEGTTTVSPTPTPTPTPINNVSFVSKVFANGQLRNDFGNWVGMRITVGLSPITIKQLGRFFVTGNNGVHTLKIVRTSDGVDVGSGSINMAQGTVDSLGYKYVTLPSPVTLSPRTSYYIVSLEQAGGDQWFGTTILPSLTTTSAAVLDSGAYYYGSLWHVVGGSGNSYVPLNFKY